MRVRFSPLAQRDIDDIHHYLSSRSPAGARSVAVAIRATIEFIAENPFGSVKTDIPDVRVKWVRGYPYKIFYRTADEEVHILHVRHTSRKEWQR